MKIFAAALAVATFPLTATVAHAASCSNKVIMDNVYQEGSNGSFQYYVQFRNATKAPVKFDIAFANFSPKVHLFNQHYSNVEVGINDKMIHKFRFGNGSDDQINPSKVDRLTDTGSSAKPYVLLTNCH